MADKLLTRIVAGVRKAQVHKAFRVWSGQPARVSGVCRKNQEGEKLIRLPA